MAIAAGVLQLILSAGCGAFWLLAGIGIAMCGDSGNGSHCSSLISQWMAFGLLAAFNACGAIMLLMTAGSPDSGRRRAAGWAAGIAAAALVLCGFYFATAAMGPVPVPPSAPSPPQSGRGWR